ncbi:MAG: acetylglutamate kinase [Dysgonamonadaceae bacterium]|nr:acetylglutamate kinase [Dysgonamonadaceae bacterium]MDD3308894.1 acetylglutamate kinase [Dysgonamonadaceae bacterium]MDD3900388.1 acetylglutamate kinase [Dysgonamonadaceae bacterium]
MPDNTKQELAIIKIGGNIVDNPDALNSFLLDFQKIKGLKVLVHGGGVLASKMAETLGVKTQKIDGRRITDAETLKIVTMVYAGYINKNIVATLQKNGCNAIGLSGADANSIPSNRRSPEPIDFGFVGDPVSENINVPFIAQLLKSDLTPVFCAITHDTNGSLLNTNADTVAYSLATALSNVFQTTLFYCFEKEGVLKDINDPESLLTTINKKDYDTLKENKIITDGMIPKLDNSFKAIENGVSKVIILHAKNLLNGKGTILTADS